MHVDFCNVDGMFVVNMYDLLAYSSQSVCMCPTYVCVCVCVAFNVDLTSP